MKKNSDYINLGNKILKGISDLTKDDLFDKIADFYSDNEEHALRLRSYFRRNLFCPSTPVIANIPENGKPFKGLPISCFLQEVESNNIDRVFSETIALSKAGGGLGTSWDKFPSIFDRNINQQNSFGVIPLIQCQGKLMRLTAGFARKTGSLAAYLSISHPDILSFIKMRKNSQGVDPEFIIPRYIHHAVVISDEFMNCVIHDKPWILYDFNGKAVEKVQARNLWLDILTIRTETGEPYIMFEDNANRSMAEHHKRLGLKFKMSNLCTEIILPTGLDHQGINRTAICCLSAINLLKYDEWKNDEQFFEDLGRFMDNILTYFIVEGGEKQIGDIVNYEHQFGLAATLRNREKQCVENAFTFNKPIANSIYSAYRSRDIGLGVAGWHSLLQSKNIAFESEEAFQLNSEIFQLLRKKFDAISIKLAQERGSCPDAAEFGIIERFSYKLAIAPTAQISSILGVTKCIEPDEPVFVSKNQAGFFLIKNPILEEILESKSMNNHGIWMKIASEGLSAVLDPHTANVFKGPFETDTYAAIKQVSMRPIDQSQSLTLFETSPVSFQSLVKNHMEAYKLGIKTLYYMRITERVKASDSIMEFMKEKNKIDECIMCQ